MLRKALFVVFGLRSVRTRSWRSDLPPAPFRRRGQSDYAANAATRDLSSNSIGLT
jgi:hypothetical protein